MLTTTLQVFGLSLGVACAVCLYFGSKDLPWDIQTCNGESEPEETFKRRRLRFARTGFSLLGSAFAFQIAAILIGSS